MFSHTPTHTFHPKFRLSLYVDTRDKKKKKKSNFCVHVSRRPQMRPGVSANGHAPQWPAVPDGGDGGSAEGLDAAEQQHSAQTSAATHRVHRGETVDQLDVHLSLRLPQGSSTIMSHKIHKTVPGCVRVWRRRTAQPEWPRPSWGYYIEKFNWGQTVKLYNKGAKLLGRGPLNHR